jgi:hypothetical protein
VDENQQQRHDDFATRVVGVALIAAIVPMWWWDYHLTPWLVDIINPVLVTTVAYGLARWKRSKLAWGMFWLLLAIYAVSMTLWVVSGLGLADTSSIDTLGGLALMGIVWALWRMPRWHPAAPPKVEHVIHYHVLHGPGMAEVDVTQMPGTELPEARPRAVPGRVLAAIEAPRIRPADVLRAVIRRRA